MWNMCSIARIKRMMVHQVRPSYYLMTTYAFLGCACATSPSKRLLVAACSVGLLGLVCQEISEDAATGTLDRLECRVSLQRARGRRHWRLAAQCAAPGEACPPASPQ